MKKLIYIGICFFSLLWFFLISDPAEPNLILKNILTAKASTTGNVAISGDVSQYLVLEFTSGANIAIGSISPGVGACNASGTIASITTNAANGYTLGLSDGSDTNSTLLHTDTTTYIPDVSGTFTSPELWLTGTTQGLGVTLFSADTTKEAKWGTGTSACDIWNKWAGIPSVNVTGHTVTGFRAIPDTSSWGWKVDVANLQKSGVYAGNVLFTSAAVLS